MNPYPEAPPMRWSFPVVLSLLLLAGPVAVLADTVDETAQRLKV